jgi:hypothetical protein
MLPVTTNVAARLVLEILHRVQDPAVMTVEFSHRPLLLPLPFISSDAGVLAAQSGLASRAEHRRLHLHPLVVPHAPRCGDEGPRQRTASAMPMPQRSDDPARRRPLRKERDARPGMHKASPPRASEAQSHGLAGPHPPRPDDPARTRAGPRRQPGRLHHSRARRRAADDRLVGDALRDWQHAELEPGDPPGEEPAS